MQTNKLSNLIGVCSPEVRSEDWEWWEEKRELSVGVIEHAWMYGEVLAYRNEVLCSPIKVAKKEKGACCRFLVAINEFGSLFYYLKQEWKKRVTMSRWQAPLPSETQRFQSVVMGYANITPDCRLLPPPTPPAGSYSLTHDVRNSGF